MICPNCNAEIKDSAKFCTKCGVKLSDYVTQEPVKQEPVKQEEEKVVKAAFTPGALSDIWPEWEIVEKPLGRGSYGVVYKAVRRDNGVESYAAIKVISIPGDSSEVDSLQSEGLDLDSTRSYFQGIVKDFVGEIQMMESLKGVQNIVCVEDYKVVEKKDEIGWDLYIRMELLTPFNTYLRNNKMTEETVIKLGCDICSALEICSQRNIIHRDIKPENIFINDFGYFKLGDFGIARKMENMTGGLSQKGTFNYMAPEVVNGIEYDARVDIYSLGIVLYRMLNGNRLPFIDNEAQLMNPNERKLAVDRRLKGEELPAPCDASPELADVILRACAYDPDSRFANATEMKKALSAVAAGTYTVIAADSLDKTTSVRKAQDDMDKTTSVRKAPVAGTEKPGAVVDTFGEAPKKKSKLLPVIAVILLVIVLLCAGIFVFSKIAGDNKEDSGVSDKNNEDVGNESDDENADNDSVLAETESPVATDAPGAVGEENINKIVTDAETLAADGDYAGALKEIEEGLAEYPDSEVLKNKANEYNDILNDQIKTQTLAEAESLAEAGDYVAAMALIQNAQDTYGEDNDYKKAYDKYQQAYFASVKEEAITTADALAANNKYTEAIQTIKDAVSLIGTDEELTNKITEYEQGYISSTISKATTLKNKKEYDKALRLLNEALKTYPDSKELKQAVADVEAAKNAESSVEVENPNQDAVLPKDPEEHDISGGMDKENAVTVQREDIYHSSFTINGEVEWFSFDTSENYSAYSIELLNNSINTTVYIAVFDSYDKELGSQLIGKGETKYLDLSLDANSTYWVRVSRYHGDCSGNYQFTIKEKICDAGKDKENAFYAVLDKQHVKAFDARGINEWYKFASTANYSTYQFTINNNSVDTTIYLTVFDEYDTELGSVSVNRGESAFLDLMLSVNKEYTVRISRYHGDRNGYYQFSISEKKCTGGLVQDEAFPLNINETFYGTVDTSFQQWYYYTFTDTGEYTLKLTNNSINTTLYATVYDMLGTDMGTLSVDKGGTVEHSLRIEAGTVLCVKITRYRMGVFGNYTINVVS